MLNKQIFLALICFFDYFKDCRKFENPTIISVFTASVYDKWCNFLRFLKRKTCLSNKSVCFKALRVNKLLDQSCEISYKNL